MGGRLQRELTEIPLTNTGKRADVVLPKKHDRRNVAPRSPGVTLAAGTSGCRPRPFPSPYITGAVDFQL